MGFNILSQLNYGTVAVCAFVFFFLGSLWFGAFFGQIWLAELRRHDVILKEPSRAAIFAKMGLNLLKNGIISFSMAYLVAMAGSTTVVPGLLLGLLVACGFAAPAMADIFIWKDHSIKLFLIDAGYQIVGITLVAIIPSVWR